MMNSSMKNVKDRITGLSRLSDIRVAKTVDSTRINQPGGHVLLVLELEDNLFIPLFKLRGKVLFVIDSITLTDKSLTEAIGADETAAAAAAAGPGEELIFCSQINLHHCKSAIQYINDWMDNMDATTPKTNFR